MTGSQPPHDRGGALGSLRKGPEVATMALDSQSSGGLGKPPIIQHRAFPAVVALWFAALLGLGSLVLPVILLEAAVDASGLAAWVPAATPPLGVTARAAIGLLAALLGAAVGWSLARRLAQAHAPAAKPRIVASAGGEKRRPISAHDELGDEGLSDGASGMRRRSLAIADDDRPSDYLLLAPLPGDDAFGGPAPVAPEQASVPPEPVASDAVAEEPLELSEIATDAITLEATPELETNMHEDDHFAWEQDPAVIGEPLAQFPSDSEKERRLDDRRSGKPGTGPGGAERRLFMRPAEAEPLPFSPPSLARRDPDNENMPAEVGEVQELDFMEDAPQTFEAAQPAANSDWSAAPLESLGLVQLVQRLGSSLEKRRELVAQTAAAAAPRSPAWVPEAAHVAASAEMPVLPVATPELFDAAPAEEAAQAMAAYFGRPAVAQPETDFAAAAVTTSTAPAPLSERMAALAATSLEPEDDEEEADDLTASFALPLRRTSPSFLKPEAADSAEPSEEGEGAFGSLLNLTNPFSAKSEEFVRVEEPEEADQAIQPAVVFPGRESSLRVPSAPAPLAASAENAPRMFDRPSGEATAAAPAAPQSPPADADEALRKALATLQRMSSSG
jgi:hypothetical protein